MMRKRKIMTLILALALCVGAVLAFSALPVSASAVRENVFTDNFDGDELNEFWTADAGVEQDAVYSCMRIQDMNIWQPAIMLQAYEVHKDRPCAVTFDVTVQKLTGWLGFFVGARSTGVAFYESSSMWMIAGNSVGYWVNDGANLVEQSGQGLDSSPLSSATGGAVSSLRFEIEYAETNPSLGNLYNVTFSFGRKGEAPSVSRTYSGVSAETYMGFTSMANLAVDIMNFRIEEKDENGDWQTAFYDDFSSGSVVYPSSGDPGANWRVTHTYGPENVFVGSLKRVFFDKVTNGKLLSDYQIQSDARCETNFEMSFTLYPDQMQTNVYFGVGLGIPNENMYADSVNMLAVRKAGADSAVFVKLVNGEESQVSAAFRLSDLGAGNPDGARITLTGYSDGSVRVAFSGRTVAFSEVESSGYFALAAVGKANASEGVELSVDDFSLDVYRYRSASGMDMAINFEGVKEFEQFGEIYREHYYNRNEWYLSGSGVSLATYRANLDTNYLQMVNAAGNVAFGPKKQVYSEFIVRFSVSMLTVAADTPSATAVGISFGKKAQDTKNENATCVWFSFDGTNTNISGMNVQTETGATSVPCELNLWQDTTTWYNVMIVVSGGTAEVYVKRSEDDMSEMGIMRAKFVGLNTYGYLALTCNTLDGKKGNCKITDFSVTNIAFF